MNIARKERVSRCLQFFSLVGAQRRIYMFRIVRECLVEGVYRCVAVLSHKTPSEKEFFRRTETAVHYMETCLCILFALRQYMGRM